MDARAFSGDGSRSVDQMYGEHAPQGNMRAITDTFAGRGERGYGGYAEGAHVTGAFRSNEGGGGYGGAGNYQGYQNRIGNPDGIELPERYRRFDTKDAIVLRGEKFDARENLQGVGVASDPRLGGPMSRDTAPSQNYNPDAFGVKSDAYGIGHLMARPPGRD
jgi:hypothetical protein